MKTIKIKWVIAHEPLRLFIRAAQFFAEALNQKSDDIKFEVEIMTLSEYSERYNNGVIVTKHDLLDLMESGKIEMSQMYSTWLAEKFYSDLHVLDMPFLFRDHQHAADVLEGEVGNELLTGLSHNSNVQGLSFTYSGGFRMIPAQKAIRSIDDFKDIPIRSNKNPFAMETFKAVGAHPIAKELEEINEGVAEGLFVGGESAWPRVYPLEQNKFATAMNDTQHSLFLTTMIIRKDFLNSLPEETKKLLKEVAIIAGRQEREESIKDGEEAKKLAKAEGIEIVSLPEAEKEKFKKMTESVYEKFETFFSPNLIKRIINQ